MIAVIGLGWGLLAFPGMAHRYLRRLHPRLWARFMVWSLSVGAGLVSVGLVAMSAPTLFEGVGAHHLAALCRKIIHDFLAGGHLGGGVALGLLTVLFTRGCMGWHRWRRGRRAAVIEPWVGDHRTHDGYELIVVSTPELIAMTAGGSARQVIVSNSLVEALDSEELTMVVRHELAHLSQRHHRPLAVAAVVESAFGWLPRVRRSVQATRLGMERWADEDAAGPDPAARRVLRSALVAAVGCRPQAGAAGFGGVETVIERLNGLNTTPASHVSRWWYLIVGGIATTAASVWLLSAAVVGVSLLASGLCTF